jgi:hypothetical protein
MMDLIGSKIRVGTMCCFLLLSLLFAVSFFHPRDAHAAQATLSWVAPTTNTDGTPLTDLAGYKIHYGTASGNYSSAINVGNTTTSAVSNLNDGATYYFAVTAYDTSGMESAYSNEVSKTTAAVQQYTLSVSKSGTGSGTVTSSSGGINCGTVCSAAYSAGAVTTLTAAPASGTTFTGWSGGGCTGTGTCSLSMNSNVAVTGSFAATVNSYTITATSGGGGTITPSGVVSVNKGTSKTFTVAPATNYQIANVQVDGASVGAISSYTFNNVSSNHTVSVTFNPVLLSCGSQPVKISSTYYSSIQTAYSAARSGADIQIVGTSLSETPTLSRSVTLTLHGGYDCGFADDSLYSVIDGALTISRGTVIIDNIIII